MQSEVLIIGAGPVGLTAALLLARHGLRVALFERRVAPSVEPRAVSLDDEGLRIWQGCGLEELLREDWAGGEEGQCICSYLDGNERTFLRIHQRTSELGHPHAVTIHQGRIEAKLLHAAERNPLIDVHRGWAVRTIRQTEESVIITGLDADGSEFVCDAPWAVACDGAGSLVRGQLGIALLGEELRHPWLVANFIDCGEPGHVVIRCRARRAAVTMPIPHGLRRVEVELDSDDDGAWMNDDAAVRRRLLAGWDKAMEAPLVNVARCRFRTMVAARWREGRVFLAGDAAHTMPPFAGQGLGAGLRDVANLSFKIAGVTQGWLAPSALDSYEEERRPHLTRMTRLASRLGRLMSPKSTLGATLLHGLLRVISAAPALGGSWLLRGPAIQPTLDRGFLAPSAWAGRYLPQPTVLLHDQRQVRFDQLLGPRMTWIILAPRSGGPPGPPRLQPPLLHPCDTVLIEGRDFRDPEQILRRRYGAASLLLVRPDRVVHSHIRPSRIRSTRLRSTRCPLQTVPR